MNCYILVGGRSRRMGQPKEAIPFGGTTFLGRIVTAASAVFDKVEAVQRRGEPAVAIETIFESAHDEEAPLFGLARALQDAAGRCFVVALDYPLITADVLRHLTERFEASAAPALVPLWSGVPQTLCAGYDAGLLPRIEERIAAGKYDLRGFAQDAELVPEAELRSRFPGEPLMNVNTPAELETARKIHERLLAFR